MKLILSHRDMVKAMEAYIRVIMGNPRKVLAVSYSTPIFTVQLADEEPDPCK